MDSRHFDAFARALGAAESRRTLLTLLGGALGLLAFAGPGAPDAVAKKNKNKKRRKRKQRQKRKKRNKNNEPCGDVCASGCQATSIQQAIEDAEDGATIRLCAETYNETLTIEKDVTLIGAGDGADGTVLDGQGNGSVVTVPGLGVVLPGATVMLEGLRITGGNSGDDLVAAFTTSASSPSPSAR